MSYKCTTSQTHKVAKPSFLAILLLTLVTLFTVGCGDSNNDYVVTGNNNNPNPATVGDLTFQFQLAPQAVVPANTTTLDFEFYDINDDVVDTANGVPFNTTVTIEDVTTSAVEVEITARGPGGVPLALIVDGVVVNGGANTNVDLTNATVTPITLDTITVTPNPVNLDVDGPTSANVAVTGVFSNGDIVPLDADTDAVVTLSGTDPTVATTTGSTVTAVGDGATTVDVSVDLYGDVASLADVPVNVAGPDVPLGTLIVNPDSLTFTNGGLLGIIDALSNQNFDSLATFRAYFIPPGETQPIEITPQAGVSFSNFAPGTVTADSFTYLNIAGEGLVLTTNPLGPTVAYGTTATMTVTYISEGVTYTSDVDITIGSPEFEEVVVPNGTLALPLSTTGNGFPVTVYARYSNGLALPIGALGIVDFGDPALGGDVFGLEVSGNANVAVNNDNFIRTTAATAGTTATATITRNGDDEATFTVNIIDGEVIDVVLTPADPATITVDPIGSYTVSVVYDDTADTVQDVTTAWFPDITPGMPGDASTLALGIFPQGGRLLGVEQGTALLELDDTDINAQLNMGLGLPGSNTVTTNDEADLDILSTVPLSFI